MSFTESIASVLRQYVGFRGRARRSEYWWFVLFSLVVSLVSSGVDNMLGIADELGNGPVGTVAGLALLLPSLAVGARRLHDTGRSGWWQLIGLIPIVGQIVLLVFLVQDSHPGANQHGLSPKYPTAVGYGYGQPGLPGQDPRYGTPPA